MHLNWIDWVIVAIVVVSCVAGMMRGLLRELLSLVVWMLAIWLAWTFGPDLEPSLGGALAYPAARPWAARGIIFIATLIGGTVIVVLVSHFVRLSIFNATDRFLGALFGILRGIVATALLVIGGHAVHLANETWWRESSLLPPMEQVANVLRSMVGERKILSSHLDNSDT